MRKPETEFTFAGFNFPRYIPEIRKSKFDNRHSRCVYYHAPKPLTGQKHPGSGFYLEDMTRIEYCDSLIRINHTGWYCDSFQDNTIRGIVWFLPHGKMLTGWTMGEGMVSGFESDIYTDREEAARAADSIAENVAEREREYQESEQEEME